MDILIVAHFSGDLDGKNNNRFNYIADLLSNENEVELVTSSFSHVKKKRRLDPFDIDLKYTVTFIEEPVYKNNISLKRIISHKKFSVNLEEYLNQRKKPDIIYLCFPSISSGMIVANYCNKNNVKLIVDIQDLWPEAFGFPLKLNTYMTDILFSKMKKQENYIFSSADQIVAVSETYLNRGLDVNTNVKKGTVLYLGTDLSLFDKYTDAFRENLEITKVVYAGTLGISYDLYTIIDGIKKASKNNNIKFIVLGDGPLKDKFEKYAKKAQIDIEFKGRVLYSEMIKILSASDIAVNPIKKGSVASIINKHGDYAAAGLPVINTQENLEYRQLVENNKIGINCENTSSDDVAKALSLLINDKKLRNEMGVNSRHLAEEKFDRKNSYPVLFNLIKEMN